MKDVKSKTSLEWYRTVKKEFELEPYIVSLQGQEAIIHFRMRTNTAGLMADKKRCGLCEEGRCLLCDGTAEENVLSF